MSISAKLHGLREVFAFDNKWQLLVNLLFFRKSSLTVYRIGTMEFVVDVKGGDVCGVRCDIATGEYKDLLPQELRSGEISVLDIGANAGGFPLMLANEGISIRRLVCVEMNPHTFTRLQFNTRHNFYPKVTCINAAICGERRTLSLSLGKGSTSDSIYQERCSTSGNSAGCDSLQVEGLLLDDVYQQAFEGGSIDICKFDVEGAEYEVFSNPGHECLRKCRWLIMEIHDRINVEKTTGLLSTIKALGFEQVNQRDDVFLFVNKELRL